ncbi:MAG: peptide chain release factor N(5)-glutamine methyltransferase, partial [Candidatus Saccharimonadales bacterium]
VLLEDISGKDRGWLLAHPEFELANAQVAKLSKLIHQRAEHEPLAYIRGKTEFYGRKFTINKHVLEPRPESETMIELLLKATPKTRDCTILDIGTGSGALAITAKLEIPYASVIASDIDCKCLEVARKNADLLTARVKFYRSNLLADIPKKLISNSIVLANLPYVPDNFKINPAAMNEPKIAIFGGPDGLDVYRKLFDQLASLKRKPDLVLTESLPPQHVKLSKIASTSGYKTIKAGDFIQVYKPN